MKKTAIILMLLAAALFFGCTQTQNTGPEMKTCPDGTQVLYSAKCPENTEAPPMPEAPTGDNTEPPSLPI